jgi:ubiquinone/menaquinone biosynthesis C-methylase UbiE
MNLLALLVVTVLAVHVVGDGYTGHSISLDHKTRNVEHDAAIFEAQVKILGPKELKRFVQFGLTDGMRILDLGCGPGFMAEQLLIHFPNSHVTCVDIDEGLLEYNRKRHENWITSGRLTVLHEWANDTKLPSESFDFVLSRLLFQHLRSTNLVDPVCKEVYRLLKPGGLFVVVDSDQFFSDLVEPNFDPMQRVERIFFELKEGDTTRPKSDNSSGRKLFTDLKRNGFENVESEVVLAHSDEHGFECVLPVT